MNIRRLFLKLTEYTIPNRMEYTLKKFFPKEIQEDGCGNYYIKIGESRTIFTCHMDTSCHKYEKVNHVFDGEFIKTDGKTVLSGDDKNGMAILLYMINQKVPGLYYFFQGEESGMIGSSCIIFKNKGFFKDYDRMISFDRRAYHSVITKQMGTYCCSDEFALELSNRLNEHGFNYKPDPTGIYTDSASFIGIIPECTNLSVGYFNEHSTRESTNIKFLVSLAKTACKIDWETLPVGEIKKEYGYYNFDEDDEYNNYFYM